MDGVGVLGWIIIGLIAGWIAEKVTGSQHGLLTNLAVGLIGAVLGGVIFNAFNAAPRVTFIANLVVATVGAIILLFLWSMVRGRR